MATPSISLIIRFGGQPIPDVPLTASIGTTVGALKSDIRGRMPASYGEHSIKLIYNGRQLRNQLGVGQELDLKRMRASDAVYFVHCALPRAEDQSFENDAAKAMFGDPTVEGLGKEVEALLSATRNSEAITTRAATTVSTTASSASAPPSHGFDRLSSISSFTAADITNMRSQFRANIAARHTPETMPSEQLLLQMEERWLDGSAFSSSLASSGAAPSASGANGESNDIAADDATGELSAALGAEAAPGFEPGQQMAPPAAAELEAEDDASSALDDTLLGVVTGFFWPVGAVVWGLREEGVWSRRRGWSVLAGVFVNLGFGVIRVMG